jgi:hypothetical protein
VTVNRNTPPFTQQPDVEVMMSNALECLTAEAFLPGDNVPGFWPDLGPLVLASAFGGRVRLEETPPWIDPVVFEPSDVAALRPPMLADGLVGEAFRRARLFHERCEGKIHLRPLDMQGPLNTAGLIWEQQRFLMATHTHAEAVHRLLSLVTDFIIEVFLAFAREFGAQVIHPYYPSICLPAGSGVGMTEDLLPLISARCYHEFGLPYSSRIAATCGGLFIHCCGRCEHHLPALAEIPGLRGLDFHYPYTRPEAVQEVLGDGRRAFVMHLGPQGADAFPGPCDFLRFGKRHWDNGMRLIFVLDSTPDHADLLQQQLETLGMADAWR